MLSFFRAASTHYWNIVPPVWEMDRQWSPRNTHKRPRDDEPNTQPPLKTIRPNDHDPRVLRADESRPRLPHARGLVLGTDSATHTIASPSPTVFGRPDAGDALSRSIHRGPGSLATAYPKTRQEYAAHVVPDSDISTTRARDDLEIEMLENMLMRTLLEEHPAHSTHAPEEYQPLSGERTVADSRTSHISRDAIDNNISESRLQAALPSLTHPERVPEIGDAEDDGT